MITFWGFGENLYEMKTNFFKQALSPSKAQNHADQELSNTIKSEFLRIILYDKLKEHKDITISSIKATFYFLSPKILLKTGLARQASCKLRPLKRLYFNFHIFFIASFFLCLCGDLDSDLNILFIATFFFRLRDDFFFSAFFFCFYTRAKGPSWCGLELIV